MNAEPVRERGGKTSPWLQIFAVVLVSVLIVLVFRTQAERAFRECVVEYPHDEQCGRDAASDRTYGVEFGGGLLAAGLGVIGLRYFLAKSKPKS
ncbi:MAG TPA: hypothetical protein VGN16_26185 [Acidobacteriaceae bacterium]|jgi:uncharacterized membrane protein YfcA